MADRHLPRPVTEGGEFLAAIHDRLGEQNELLGRILERLPEPAPQPEQAGTVELREPEQPKAAGAEIAEPSPAPAKRTRKPRTPSK
ncbi:hypothetical protein AB0L65_33075 [Nonomuraea sp. NPDC052116]|uniref:hypothetical protein n=1 Tax=Nonomuraea sp. NPDC052116 TaxID=3155665 RepID=UPI0034472E2F